MTFDPIRRRCEELAGNQGSSQRRCTNDASLWDPNLELWTCRAHHPRGERERAKPPHVRACSLCGRRDWRVRVETWGEWQATIRSCVHCSPGDPDPDIGRYERAFWATKPPSSPAAEHQAWPNTTWWAAKHHIPGIGHVWNSDDDYLTGVGEAPPQ